MENSWEKEKEENVWAAARSPYMVMSFTKLEVAGCY